MLETVILIPTTQRTDTLTVISPYRIPLQLSCKSEHGKMTFNVLS